MRKFLVIMSIFILLSYSIAMAYEKEIKNISDSISESVTKSGKKKIAVVDFTDLQSNITELGRFLAEELSVDLTINAKNYSVIDRTHLKSILAEHKLSMSGLVDPNTVKQLGQIAGVDAIVTGTVTPFGDSIRITVKVITTDTAEMIGASKGEIAKTKAIEELLARGIETNLQSKETSNTNEQKNSISSSSYIQSIETNQKSDRVIQDSYFKITMLNIFKSGNKGVTIQLEYENLTDKEINVQYGHATSSYDIILFDNNGNKSKLGPYEKSGDIIVPAKGKKSLGFAFEFDAKELGNVFNLTINHRSNPPGSISFVNLKAKKSYKKIN